MAEKALAHAFKILGKKPSGKTLDRLPGTPEKPWNLFFKEETSKWVSTYSLSKLSQAEHLAYLYGQRAESVLKLIAEDPRLQEPLHPDRPELLALVAFAVQNEKAVHLEDVLLRRLEIGYSAQRWGLASEKASHLMAELLSWDENTRQLELDRYRHSLYPHT
jgi:glycerol-3-phosphate dehydrogenase